LMIVSLVFADKLLIINKKNKDNIAYLKKFFMAQK